VLKVRMPLAWLARCLLVLALALPLGATDFSTLAPAGYVSDFAGVVDAQTRRALNEYCARVETATGAQIALVTLDSLEAQPIEDVADLLFRKWGVGDKRNNEGVLVLLAIRDRRSRVEVGYGLEPVIPDGFAGSILRDLRPALRAGDYGQALAAAATGLGRRIAAAKNVAIPDAAAGRARRLPKEDPIPFPVLIGGGVLALLVLSRFLGGGGRHRGGGGGSLLAGMLLGHLLSGGRSGRGGGGFGGYDSGDSFGGFGGGDSGGGGASSSW
jgi:uncharacterized protein